MTDAEGKSLTVWPISVPRPKIGYEAVVNVEWSNEEEKALALRIIGSIRRTP